VLIRTQIIVPCMTVELSSWCLAPKRCMMTSRVGMYLNWNRSRRNTASTAHTHKQLPQLYVSSCSGVGSRRRYSRCGGLSVWNSALVTQFISRHKSVSPAIPFHGRFLENVNITLVFSVLALFKNCARSIVPSHRTQSTFCAYIHTKLLLICLLAPSYYYHQIYAYYCFDGHHKYSTIITVKIAFIITQKEIM